MKRLLSILFLGIYLSSALYASVQLHFCQDVLQSFKVVLHSDAENACCCGGETPCCKDENITIATDLHAFSFAYKVANLQPQNILKPLLVNQFNSIEPQPQIVWSDQLAKRKRTHTKPLYLLFQTRKMAEPAPFAIS